MKRTDGTLVGYPIHNKNIIVKSELVISHKAIVKALELAAFSWAPEVFVFGPIGFDEVVKKW